MEVTEILALIGIICATTLGYFQIREEGREDLKKFVQKIGNRVFKLFDYLFYLLMLTYVINFYFVNEPTGKNIFLFVIAVIVLVMLILLKIIQKETKNMGDIISISKNLSEQSTSLDERLEYLVETVNKQKKEILELKEEIKKG